MDAAAAVVVDVGWAMQRQARHFIICRRARLYVLGLMWKKIMKEVSGSQEGGAPTLMQLAQEEEEEGCRLFALTVSCWLVLCRRAEARAADEPAEEAGDGAARQGHEGTRQPAVTASLLTQARSARLSTGGDGYVLCCVAVRWVGGCVRTRAS